MKKFIFLGVLLVLIHGLFVTDNSEGAVDGGCGDIVLSGPATLTDSGPVTSSSDGQVLENLRITASGSNGITVTHDNVIIRNVEILHNGDRGIFLNGADNALIENVNIINTGAPPSGANPSFEWNNIELIGSSDVVVKYARLTKGSSGIYLVLSPRAHLSFIEGYDMRGPMPRGQLVQFNNSPDGVLEDFYNYNDPGTSHPEDNISSYSSTNIAIRRGLIDGNNSPSGVSVMFETGSHGGLAEDVDVIHAGNGCFSATGIDDTTFRRTRCKDNICTDQGRGLPASGGLMWHSWSGATNTSVYDSSYWNNCKGSLWDWGTVITPSSELANEDFTLRDPILLRFSWESDCEGNPRLSPPSNMRIIE